MRRKTARKWAVVLCLVMLLALVAGCGKSETPAPAEDTIKLGFLGAKTVKNANYGIPGEKGMKMAIEEINAKGGVLGKKLEGIYEDNKGDSRDCQYCYKILHG